MIKQPCANVAELFVELPNLASTPRRVRRFGCKPTALVNAEIWNGGLRDNWVALCEWLLERHLVLTRDKLESFLRLMPPDVVFKLATNLPGHRVKEMGCGRHFTFQMSGRWASLIVRQGNKFGHLCNIEALCPEGDIQEWAKAMAETFGPIPYPNSAGTVAGNLLRWPLPAKQYPTLVLSRAWNCCKASRMEALTVGTVQGYAYDYTAAFPSVARMFPEAHPARCRWVDSPEYHSDAYYGFIRAQVTIPEEIEASPITFRYAAPSRVDDPLHIAHPTGRMAVWLEKSELELIQELGYPYNILEASWGYPSGNLYPFRGVS